MERSSARSTVLVTGGCGFVGGHLVRSLARHGHRVVVVDRLPWRDGHAESVRLDVTDPEGCREVMREVDPKVVFHLAASSTIDSAFADPHGSLMCNVTGTMNLLEAARRHCTNLHRFVLASTDKVYGELRADAYLETSPLAAQGVYDVGKLAADTVTRLYGDELGLPVATLRLCNVFGPGDRHTGSRIVPRTLSRLFAPDGPLPPVVYEGSMEHGRDYVYVSDAVRALRTVAFHPRALGEVFNMAPAAHRTTLDLVEDLIEEARRACEKSDPDRARAIVKNGYEVVAADAGAALPRALTRQHCDATKLGGLGFRVTVSMKDGLRRTVRAFSGSPGRT
ncbi:NAD-dependent epimerase/dehydratase family protein [Saccharomonospora xinjiangensis]|uniref:NAD-dependent epimerase/dehydratase family protein n=1 Tax=Saccharomonospora xinjiangensis TaxID=75294 RepID=UPI003510013E